MAGRKTQSIILALGLAGIVGSGIWIGNVQRKAEARRNAEFSALFNAVETAQEIAGKDGAVDGPGQELLDCLGVNYRLKANEKVKLDVGSTGAYVNVETIPRGEYGLMRGFANRSALEKYISLHKDQTANK